MADGNNRSIHREDECPFATDLRRVIKILDGNGQEGIVKIVESLAEWREREEDQRREDRSARQAERISNKNGRIGLYIGLLLLGAGMVAQYIHPPVPQIQYLTTTGSSQTTHTDSKGQDTYSTTDSNSTQSAAKKGDK